MGIILDYCNSLTLGNPKDGIVGWVNKQQVKKVRQTFYRPDIQTIYIHSDRAKSGKPVLNIVAYKNGKKLSPAEAKKLYGKIRKQQERQMHDMQRMNRMMRRQQYNMNQLFNGFWTNEPWVKPVIIFPEPGQNIKPNKSAKDDELDS